jgi:DNA-directed RNA polymerase specialized sigma24 family protein
MSREVFETSVPLGGYTEEACEVIRTSVVKNWSICKKASWFDEDDLWQELALITLAKEPPCIPDDVTMAWLCTFLHFECLHIMRKVLYGGRRSDKPSDTTHSLTSDWVIHREEPLDDPPVERYHFRIRSRELPVWITELLSLLPFAERRTITMIYLEGYNLDDVAYELNVSWRTAHRTKQRALKRLRQLIAE